MGEQRQDETNCATQREGEAAQITPEAPGEASSQPGEVMQELSTLPLLSRGLARLSPT